MSWYLLSLFCLTKVNSIFILFSFTNKTKENKGLLINNIGFVLFEFYGKYFKTIGKNTKKHYNIKKITEIPEKYAIFSMKSYAYDYQK